MLQICTPATHDLLRFFVRDPDFLFDVVKSARERFEYDEEAADEMILDGIKEETVRSMQKGMHLGCELREWHGEYVREVVTDLDPANKEYVSSVLSRTADDINWTTVAFEVVQMLARIEEGVCACCGEPVECD